MKKILNIITVAVFAILIFSLSAFSFLKADTEYSMSERRYLKEKPIFNAQSVFSGEFMKNFEEYTTDQFPFREKFRTLKALFSTKVMGKMENNKIYTESGHISKIEYPMNQDMLDYAIHKFDSIYNRYLKNCNVYFSIVPDKNYFLAHKKGYPSIDYEDFISQFKTGLSYMEYIDIIPLLSEEDYYYTDSHWKQENIQDIAVLLGEKMGVSVADEYKVNEFEKPFNGVYLGQSALNHKGDTLKYLTSETLDNLTVTYFDNGMPKTGEIYDMKKANGKDPYEMFLSGTSPIVTMENENSTSDKELIIFRDSFGGSIAPLLTPGYKKVTVVDIRYVQSDFLGSFIEFNNQDVLFLYSTTLLNNSTALR